VIVVVIVIVAVERMTKWQARIECAVFLKRVGYAG
jgi:hypothetical protein